MSIVTIDARTGESCIVSLQKILNDTNSRGVTICENYGVRIPLNRDTVIGMTCVMTVVTTEPTKKGLSGITGMTVMSQNASFVASAT
ncbi:MAG: hypothetical protein AB7D06_04275 [Pedobacter sp.]